MTATTLRRLTVGALCIGVLAATATITLSGHAGADTDAETLLEQSRAASSTATVAGIVEVRWRDGDTVHVGTTSARARGGAYVVGGGDDVAVGLGGVRWAADDAVAIRSDLADEVSPPSPGAAWDLEVGDDTEVVGRPAQVVLARHGDGPVRARFYVDATSGLLLRRDVLERDGDIVRSVRYTQLATDAAGPPVTTIPVASRASRPDDELDDEFLAPERLDRGFRLLGHTEQPGGAIQLFYSDGLFSLSLFQQPGLVDWDGLPAGGHRRPVDDDRAQWYATDTGSMVVWGRDGLVLTGVSDAPPDTVRAAVATLDGTDGGVVDDVIDFVFGPFGWS